MEDSEYVGRRRVETNVYERPRKSMAIRPSKSCYGHGTGSAVSESQPFATGNDTRNILICVNITNYTTTTSGLTGVATERCL